jgi:hypothetical protein
VDTVSRVVAFACGLLLGLALRRRCPEPDYTPLDTSEDDWAEIAPPDPDLARLTTRDPSDWRWNR